MKTLRLLVTATCFAFLAAATAHAQTATAVTPQGAYSFVTESGYAGPDLSGFTVSFDKDNAMTVTGPDGSLIVKSKLTFADGVMTLNDQDGSNVCQYAGKYKVLGDVSSFKLQLVEDGCSDRSAIITTVKFVRHG